jgi:hypothetical protein
MLIHFASVFPCASTLNLPTSKMYETTIVGEYGAFQHAFHTDQMFCLKFYFSVGAASRYTLLLDPADFNSYMKFFYFNICTPYTPSPDGGIHFATSVY